MKTIAKKYIRTGAGQILLEMVSLKRGKYIVARNGQISDARKKIGREEAEKIVREWEAE